MVTIMLMMHWSLSQITPSHSLACQCGAKFTAKEPLVTFMSHRRGFKPRFTYSDLGLASAWASPAQPQAAGPRLAHHKFITGDGRSHRQEGESRCRSLSS